MKRITSYIILALLFVGTVIIAVTENTVYADVSTSLTVDEDSIIKASHYGLIGIHDPGGAEPGLRGSVSVNSEVTDAFKVYGFKTGFIRIGATDWKKSIGNLSDRGYDSMSLERGFGIAEKIKFYLDINPDMQFQIMIDIDMPDDDLRDYIRYLTMKPDDDRAIGADGVNYALLRQEHGIADPLNLIVLEMGNETDQAMTSTEKKDEAAVLAAAEVYVEKCSRVIGIIRDMDCNIPIAVHAFTEPHTANYKWNVWNQHIVSELGARCQYIAVHKYYHIGSDLYRVVDRTAVEENVMQYVDLLTTDEKPEIYMSEHAIWLNESDAVTDNRFRITGLGGTLATAEVINHILNNPDIGLSNYHAMFGVRSTVDSYGRNSWGILRPYVDDTIILSVVGEYFKMIYDSMGENVVKTTLSGENINGTEPLTVSAQTTAEGGLNIVFVNRSSTVGHNVNISTKRQYAFERQTLLSGGGILEENTPAEPDKITAQVDSTGAGELFTGCYVPPMCVKAVYLAPYGSDVSEQEVNIRINKTDVRGNEATITANDNVLRIEADFCQTDSAGVDFGSVITVTDSQQNVVYLNQIPTVRNRACFEVKVPDENEVYKITVKNTLTGVKRIVDINYISAPDILKIEIDDINNNEYCAEATVTFKSGFEGEVLAQVTNKNTGEPVYYNIIKADSVVKRHTFLMPNEAPSGEYVFSAGELSQTFNFHKPSELVRIASQPKNTDGNLFTYTDIGKGMSFELENISNGHIDAVVYAVCYDKGGKLAGAVYSDICSMDSMQKTVCNVPAFSDTLTDIGGIKLYVWADAALTPLTDYYIIKK